MGIRVTQKSLSDTQRRWTHLDMMINNIRNKFMVRVVGGLNHIRSDMNPRNWLSHLKWWKNTLRKSKNAFQILEMYFRTHLDHTKTRPNWISPIFFSQNLIRRCISRPTLWRVFLKYQLSDKSENAFLDTPYFEKFHIVK